MYIVHITAVRIRKKYKEKLNSINPINNGNPFYPLLMRQPKKYTYTSFSNPSIFHRKISENKDGKKMRAVIRPM